MLAAKGDKEIGDRFNNIFDQARVRELDAWDQVDDVESAALLLVSSFFQGRGSAIVAARALWQAPIAEIVVLTLVHALPQLHPRPALQHIAALTLLSLTENREIDDWATDPNPVLRCVRGATRTKTQPGPTLSASFQLI